VSRALIRAALESRLATWAAARTPVLAIAWENVAAPSAPLYLRANLLPATTTSDTLDGAHRAYRGLLQVMVVAPIGAGPAVADAIAGELEALFPVNLRLPQGGLAVHITNPASAAPALQDDTSYRVPVSIPYRVDVTP